MKNVFVLFLVALVSCVYSQSHLDLRSRSIDLTFATVDDVQHNDFDFEQSYLKFELEPQNDRLTGAEDVLDLVINEVYSSLTDTWVNQSIFDIDYDDQGRTVKSVFRIWSVLDHVWQNQYKVIPEYDDAAMKSLSTSYVWDPEAKTWNYWSRSISIFNDDELIEETLVLEFNGLSGIWDTLFKVAYAYDENALNIGDTLYAYEPDGTWRLSSRHVRTYENSLLIEDLSQLWHRYAEEWINSRRKTSSYTQDGLLSGYIRQKWSTLDSDWENESKESYQYDAERLRESSAYWLWNATEGWELQNTQAYYYDSEDRNSTSTETTWGPIIYAMADDYRYLYAYDARDSLIEEIFQSWDDSTEILVNRSRETWAYDGQGNKVLQARYRWIEQGEEWQLNYEYTAIYDESGNLIEQQDRYPLANRWNRYLSSYNVDGNRTEFVIQNWDRVTEEWVNQVRRQYKYDARGNLLDYTHQVWGLDLGWINNQRTLDLYDENDLQLESLIQFWDDEWINSSKTTWEYDGEGRQLKSFEYRWNNDSWTYLRKTEWTYDQAGSFIEEILYDWSLLDEIWIHASKSISEFTQDGRRFHYRGYHWDADQNTWQITYEITTVRDAQGRIIESRMISYGSEYSDGTLISYDEEGRIIEEIYIGFNFNSHEWEVSSKYTSVYDDQGVLQEEGLYAWSEISSGWILAIKIEYINNQAGNPISALYYEIDELSGQLALLGEILYEYDGRGNVLSELVRWLETTEYGWAVTSRTTNFWQEDTQTSVSAVESQYVTCTYPNPFVAGASVFSFESSMDIDDVSFVIYDITGKALVSRQITPGDEIALKSSFMHGLYVIVVSGPSQILFRGKVIID